MKDKAYNMIKELPGFWVVYITACYILSFNFFYDNWFQEFSVKAFECSVLVLAVFWVLAVKENWSKESKTFLVFLSAISIIDMVYVFNRNLQEYDSKLIVMAYILALFYWRNEMNK